MAIRAVPLEQCHSPVACLEEFEVLHFFTLEKEAPLPNPGRIMDIVFMRQGFGARLFSLLNTDDFPSRFNHSATNIKADFGKVKLFLCHNEDCIVSLQYSQN